MAYHLFDVSHNVDTQQHTQTLVSQSIGLQGALCLLSACPPFKSGLLA